MYPDEFDYYRAGSVDEALALLEEHADRETELLAGGHSLLPTMKTGLASPDAVIDIGHIDGLQGIDRGSGTLSFGALTDYATIADSETAWESATTIAEAAGAVGDAQVRNMGTIGGNIAHADPASDLPAAVLASEATVVARGPDGERTIDVDEFFQGMYATALAPDEILTGIEVPALGEDDVGAYAKKPSPSSGYAMVGVAVALRLDGEAVESARVAANGAMDHAVRLSAAEDALEGGTLDADAIEAAGDAAGDGLDTAMMMDDVQASAQFRAQLLGVYTERALESALDRAAAPAAAD